MELMLRQERLRRGWTQQYVAEKVGVTKSAILLLENGKTKPSYDVLVKLFFHSAGTISDQIFYKSALEK